LENSTINIKKIEIKQKRENMHAFFFELACMDEKEFMRTGE